MAIYAGGQAGGGGTAAPSVFPPPSVFVQYQGTPVDHEVIPQPPPLTWRGGMTVRFAQSGGLTVTFARQG